MSLSIILSLVLVISLCFIVFLAISNKKYKYCLQEKDNEISHLSISSDEQRRAYETNYSEKVALCNDLQNKLDISNKEINTLTSEFSKVKTLLDIANLEIEKNKQEQQLISDQIKLSFRDIATSIIEEKNKSLKHESESIINPLKEQIEQFKKKIEEVYIEEGKERHSLKNQITMLLEQSNKISDEANSLTKALKGNSKMQGDWGEMILENILENSGLEEGVAFLSQPTLKDLGVDYAGNDNGLWERLRPDVVIKYPNGRYIVVDSKVSLTAYSNMIETEGSDIEKKYLSEHIQSIRSHIKELSSKNYEKYIKSSPDFVMMFIPNDNAYNIALKECPSLWNEAYRDKVVLINASNLIAAVMMFKDMWNRDTQIKNVEKIVERASSLYDKFANYVDTFDRMGQKLDDAKNCFEDAKKQLSTGRGNFIKQLNDLKNMGGLSTKRQIKEPVEQ